MSNLLKMPAIASKMFTLTSLESLWGYLSLGLHPMPWKPRCYFNSIIIQEIQASN